MKCSAALFGALTIFLLSGCSSARTGSPSDKVWYKAGTSAQERRRDLAMSQYEAAVSGRSYSPVPADSAGRAIVLGWMASVAESSRENKIVAASMIAKGYSLVDKHSPLLTNCQPTQLFNDSPELIAKMLGHWESTSAKAKKMDQGIEKITLDFFLNHRLLQTTFQNGKVFPILEYYTAKGEKLAAWDPSIGRPRPNDYAHFSLVDDQMIISSSDFQMVLQRGAANHNQIGQPPEISDEISNGHWVSIWKTTNGVTAVSMEYSFSPHHRFTFHIVQTLQNIEQHEEGLYYYDGKKLVMWCDEEAEPESFDCSVTADSMKYSDGRIVLQFTKSSE